MVRIRIRIMAGWTLFILNVVALGLCLYWLGLPGLVAYTLIGMIQMIVWAARGQDTAEKRRRREVAFVRADGKIVYQGKFISLKDARKRALKLEYEDEPKKKKTNFWGR